ncbi:MAG: aldo/keto reductase [Saprospiraceae bacterium]|nr:aldo/keto reductase [Saprospiraceae bacterium]|tara:strand:- start:527 stop:1519 length:993 start_codon:yes stop_codon:yes gene_type:complete
MNYKYLGSTGVKVSSLCFGTMTFGGMSDMATSKKVFNRCRDVGINFFDCADVYEKGKSEEILGTFIKECRDEVVITSKAYFRTGPDVNAMGATRYHIVRTIEASLRRLKTDYIDLYFVHRFDEQTPLEETLGVLNDMVRQGKVLYLGASNYAAWQVSKALGISERKGWSKFDCLQPMYNLVKRQAEVEILPMAISERLGVISYSPLGGGLFTGKYGKLKRPSSGRLMENKMYKIRYGEDWVYDVAEKFSDLANEIKVHPVSLAIAWVGYNKGITAPIIGARNVTQLEASLDSINVDMNDELWNRISALSYQPPTATDRNEEKSDYNYGLR